MTQYDDTSAIERLAEAIKLLAISHKTILTTKEAATYLGYKPETVRTHAHNGEIPYYVRGHQTWFRRKDLDEWVCSDHKEQQSELDRRAEEYMRTLRACAKRQKA